MMNRKQLTFGPYFGLAGLGLVLCLSIGMSKSAHALTIVLDWTTTSTDVLGQQTGAFDAAPWSVISGTSDGVHDAALAGVIDHYLAYPTMAIDTSSPLPVGKELDINFVNGMLGTASSNGDPDFFVFKIGDGLAGANATNPNTFGNACFGCLRRGGGRPNIFGLVPTLHVAGSIWPNNMEHFFTVARASDRATYLNLLVGTISHEIGHTLALAHRGPSSSKGLNPGASDWGLMGSGATDMPITDRVLGREFTYVNFDRLIGSVGMRDVAANVSIPDTLFLMSTGLVLAGLRRRASAV